MSHKNKHAGFTIVELLIVIVVIGILAALVLNSFSGAQAKARDAQRKDDVAKLRRALEAYKIQNGQYPEETANPGNGGWELSSDAAGTFLEALKSGGYFAEVPVDPQNTTDKAYYYYRYSPGAGGCDTSRGAFYVIRVSFEDPANKPRGNAFSDTVCSAPPAYWSDSGSYSVWGAFEN